MKNHLICLAVGLGLTACAAKGPACSVIKVANDVCTYLEYQDDDGNTQRVKLSRQDVEQMAREKAAKEGLPPPRSAPGTEEGDDG